MRRVGSTDGVEIAVHDFGGTGLRGLNAASGAPLVLVHATGFCAAVLEPLARRLGTTHHSWGLDLRGHGASTRGPAAGRAWEDLADDVLAAVDGLALDRPVGFGHSSGGAALLLAEARRPGTFRELWCFEPIVWPDPEKVRGRGERLAEGSRRRRRTFPSREEAYANYAAKPPFSVLAPECLHAYVDCGLTDAPDGTVVLRCDPDDEAEIYLQGVVGDRFGRLSEVGCRVTVACGEASDAIGPDRAAEIASALPAGELLALPGLGHFGPLEDPAAMARALG